MGPVPIMALEQLRDQVLRHPGKVRQPLVLFVEDGGRHAGQALVVLEEALLDPLLLEAEQVQVIEAPGIEALALLQLAEDGVVLAQLALVVRLCLDRVG